jgi:peptide/nickel transport system substrate-binding protein
VIESDDPAARCQLDMSRWVPVPPRSHRSYRADSPRIGFKPLKGPRMFRTKSLAGIAVAVVLVMAAAGCGGRSSPGGGGTQAGGTLTLGLIRAATTFEAKDINFANESPYGQAVYDTLLKDDPEGNVQPSLATEWSYNDTKTVLNMTLRSDVKFTDGTPFNAAAAAQNLIRFRDGNSPNKTDLSSLQDAKAVDDTHLQITLKQSDPRFLVSLTRNGGMQQSPASFNKPDAKTNPVGSGPYILDHANTVVGSSYAFTKNPNYWNKADQHYDKLVMRVFNDPTSMLNAVRGKQLNGAKLVNNDFVDQVKGTGYNLVDFELDWSGLLLLDRGGTLNPALKDVRVRQAINHAFDKQALLRAVQKGYGTATGQIFSPKSAAYDPALDTRYDYNPTRAKELLAQAGYPNGFTLAMPTSAAVGTTVFTLIGQQLKDVGITVQFTDVGNQLIPEILARKWAASWFQLQQDTDWQVITFNITPDATWNPFKTTDPKVTELAEKVRAGTEAEAGAAAKELNRYVVEQAWWAPWYRIKSHYATDANTQVVAQRGNAYPYLWNFKPKR